MEQQIQEVQAQGFKPVIFIENALKDLLIENNELMLISNEARRLKVPVFSEYNVEKLNRVNKAYVFRYGTIPLYTEVRVKRKGGKIVSGNLRIE